MQDDLAQRVQHLMDIEVGFEQMVPAGMSIDAKEVARTGMVAMSRGSSGSGLSVVRDAVA